MIHDDTLCELGEGALWHPQRQQLFWCDIMGRRLHTKGKVWQFDEYVSAAGWLDENALLIATENALRHLDLTTGEHRAVVPLEGDKPGNRSNDGRADPYGGFWIGTMGIEKEKGVGAIYRYYRGELRQLYGGLSIPNAICFTPDGKHAYFTDTPEQQIMRVALDDAGWPKGDPTLHIDLRGTDYRPDGAVVDARGNLWNAQWGVGRVAGYSPEGEFLESFGFAGRQTSCPAFGGKDLKTLFCTTAREGIDGAQDGKTFMAETRHQGQAEHRVIL